MGTNISNIKCFIFISIQGWKSRDSYRESSDPVDETISSCRKAANGIHTGQESG
jgi:hypothetical protein